MKIYFKYIFFILVFLLILGGVYFSWHVLVPQKISAHYPVLKIENNYIPPGVWQRNNTQSIFWIPSGKGLSWVAHQLKQRSLISSEYIFKLITLILGQHRSINSGVYYIPPRSSYWNIVSRLSSHQFLKTKVLIPEGFNLFEIAQLLESINIIEKAQTFVKMSIDPDFIQSLGLSALSVEGYLFPDTYLFSLLSSSSMIIKEMINNFTQKIRQLDSGYSSKGSQMYALIKIASLIEKEYKNLDQVALISSVIWNRLHKKKRLQLDPPSFVYIPQMEDWSEIEPNIKKVFPDLIKFNTYRRSGLPLTPIANPGLLTLQAALSPAQSDYFYFVLKDPESTEIVFSKTFEEHVRYATQYRQSRYRLLKKKWK